MFLLVLLFQIPGHPVLSIFSNRCTRSKFNNALNTMLFPPYTSSIYENLLFPDKLSRSKDLRQYRRAYLWNNIACIIHQSQSCLSSVVNVTMACCAYMLQLLMRLLRATITSLWLPHEHANNYSVSFILRVSKMRHLNFTVSTEFC